ncbi:14168_t:CDS:2 [Acaulospora morrowiae]|uniref:14168_t:CDS:1 n=1 Tax=Acaulospora morrowiae TaxID=94023 RepID=A0A9N9CCU8_9GLOM|nr:14168_t:CDS:2 [Acaulospora morrowiae]
MPPNPPEEFSPATISAYTSESETTTTPVFSSSEKYLTNPYNSMQHLANMGTTTTNVTEHNLTPPTDGPRIDTEFVIRGHQKQIPTRKRSNSKPLQDLHTFALSSTPSINSNFYNNNNHDNLKTSHFDIPNLQSINFDLPYKSNSLLGKLRQQYEPVEKEKVISSLASKVLPSEKSGSSINSLSDLVKYLFSSINIVSVKFLVLCLLWYASSAVTNNIGKQILNQFKHPVTLTWIQFGFVGLYCYVIGHTFGYTRIKRPTKSILRTTLPLSLFSITGHVLSSVATSIVPVSFVHTTKALSPLFTVFFYRFGFKVNYSYRVYISLIPLTIGVMLACSSSSTASFIGFLFALGSTIIFVAQNIFSKKLLFNQSHPGYERHKLDELNLSFYSSTTAFFLMIPLWLYYEGFRLIFLSPSSPTSSNGWLITFYFWLNGTTHFAQNILALSILSITSPVTYSIASLVKRIFVVTASIIWFGQKTSLTQGIGIFLTFGGLYMYNQAKRDVEKKERKAREREEIVLPLTRSEKSWAHLRARVIFQNVFTL